MLSQLVEAQCDNTYRYIYCQDFRVAKIEKDYSVSKGIIAVDFISKSVETIHTFMIKYRL